jgi:hypothetical protein
MNIQTTVTRPQVVLSLYDFTGEAVRPWAEAGYACHIFDIQHPEPAATTPVGNNGGSITAHRADLHALDGVWSIKQAFEGFEVVFMSAFPVCTDLAVSGAAWFAKKEAADPLFQVKAARYANWCGQLGELLGCPYYIENPVSRLATLWRKPDHRFDPFEYGGYIPQSQAEHPRWPEYIAPFDAYPKRTCLWTGGGFEMPNPKPVERFEGYSTQHKKLGGKSQRTKDIRSATPRGFAKAVFLANQPKVNA